MIPHNRPFITAEDRAAVDAVLASGWIAQGPAVEALEAAFVGLYGGGAACALSSGTAALFLALKAVGIDAGKRVAVPSYACSALLNAVVMAGAEPVPVDVLADTFAIDPDAVRRHAADAAAIIAVHPYGAPADVAALRPLAPAVVEDCCQSLGGTGPDGPLGAEGDAAVFSFYATKIVTGGQGGLVWSRDAETIANVIDYRQFDCRETYSPRFNLQLTDIQAALAGNQMKRLEAIRRRRLAIAETYLAALPAGLDTQAGLAEAGRMAHRFVVVTPDAATRDALQAHMERAGVGCAVPLERYELLHRYLDLSPDAFPVAERLVDTTLSLPLHMGLGDDQVAQVAAALAAFAP